MDIISSSKLFTESLEFEETTQQNQSDPIKILIGQPDNLVETIKTKRRECKVK